MTRTPPRRRPALRYLAGSAAVAVLLASSVGFAAAERYDAKIERVKVFTAAEKEARPKPAPEAPLPAMNVLIVGIDNREGLTREQEAAWHLGHGDYGNQTDTIMVVHIGEDAGHVTVVGLPRDSLVEIPGYTDADGTQHGAHMDKINAAFTLGGPALTVKTVENATGIKIDHYVGVSFLGFMAMVDAVDGVDVCLDAPIKDNPKYTSLDLPAGRSTIRGGMALSFVRARHVGTDFGRMKRQQQFMASLLKKATSLGIVSNPVRLDSFVSAAAESLQVDDSLDKNEIISLARRLSSVQLDQIEFARLPIADDNATNPETGGAGYVTWGDSGSKRIFDAIINDKPLVVKKATTSPTPKPSGPAATVMPGDITVRVFNGSGVVGLGKKASTELSDLGFVIADPPASSPDAASRTTVIRYDPVYDTSLLTLRQAFPGAKVVPVDGQGKVFEVTVGSSFRTTSTPVVAAPTTTADPTDISAEQTPVLASSTVCK